MTNQEINIALSGKDDNILPSSGFLDSVMAAVESEASALPAIAFPWKRAVPGIFGSVFVLVALVASFVSAWRLPQLSSSASPHFLAYCSLAGNLLQRPAALSTVVAVFLLILCTAAPWRFARTR